nr:MAG TPA: hypothetical protein [Caudoviricetes sp.]
MFIKCGKIRGNTFFISFYCARLLSSTFSP